METLNPFYQEGPNPALQVNRRIHSQKDERELDLSLCNLEYAPLDAIQRYHGRATALNLSHNFITYLNPGFPMDMQALTKLDLSSNMIKKLPSDIGRMSQLTYLDLHKNLLETLPVSMSKLIRLQYLNISSNPLQTPLKDFMKIQAVKERDEDYKISVIHPIVQFLIEIARAVPNEASGDTVENVRIGRKRSVTFESGLRDHSREGTYSESDEYDDGNRQYPPSSRNTRGGTKASVRGREGSRQLRQSREASHGIAHHGDDDLKKVTWGSRAVSFAKGFFSVLTLLALTPFAVATVVDHGFFQNLPKDSWWNYYQPLHSGACRVFCHYLGLEMPLMVHAPPPPDAGFFSAIFTSIYQFISCVAGKFVFW